MISTLHTKECMIYFLSTWSKKEVVLGTNLYYKILLSHITNKSLSKWFQITGDVTIIIVSLDIRKLQQGVYPHYIKPSGGKGKGKIMVQPITGQESLEE
jgi:hypothetical protein